MIIGIAGKARSGKDTFANFLINEFEESYNRLFKTTAFAHRLKQMCVEHFMLNREQLWGGDKEVPDKRYPKTTKPYCKGLGKSDLPKSNYWTAREIMQELGSFYRKIDNNFWVNQVDSTWKLSSCPDVVITDARHINECDYIKENGILIRVTRNEDNKIHGMSHESEVALDGKPDSYFDLTVVNERDLFELQLAAIESAKIILQLEKLKEQGRKYNVEEK